MLGDIFSRFNGPFFKCVLHTLAVGGNLFVYCFHFGLGSLSFGNVFAADHIDHGRGIAIAGLFAAVRVVVEEGVKLVVFPVGDRIIFMAVALGAFNAEAKKHIAGGFNAVDHVFNPVFFDDQAALVSSAVVAIEAGGDFLIIGRIGDEISRELFGGEILE